MSNSFDMNGWDLFNTPFSKPVRTDPQRQQAGRSQQKPAEPTQRNITPSESARRNSTPAQTQKTPPLSHQAPNTQQKQPAVKQPNPALSAPFPADKKPAPKAVTPAQPEPTKHEPVDSTKAPANTQPAEPQKELVLDMSSGSDTAQDDAARRKAHEEAEAKRKSEFDERQREKKLAEEAALQKLNAMSDADIIAAAAKRVSTDTERLTRRNMKECVAEYIQTLCRENPAFAKKVMHPNKNMIRCFAYINRMARDFLREEMENNGIKPENGIYGGDVPDAICLQWAFDYFDNPEVNEEVFVPKSYVPSGSKTSKLRKKKTEPKKKPVKPENNGCEQLTLEGLA